MAGAACTLVVRLAVVGLQRRSNWRSNVMGSDNGCRNEIFEVVEGVSWESKVCKGSWKATLVMTRDVDVKG